MATRGSDRFAAEPWGMCGIACVIGSELPTEPRRLAASECMRHRGPDDGGSFAAEGVWLGHRRLAIIDLSPLGHQPLTDPETGVTIVYNGEIFNYPELRAELEARGHRFRSRCDTEVLL